MLSPLDLQRKYAGLKGCLLSLDRFAPRVDRFQQEVRLSVRVDAAIDGP